jgi:hypothetical protein
MSPSVLLRLLAALTAMCGVRAERRLQGGSSVCSASTNMKLTVCPSGSPCNPAAIEIGDEVTLRICIENDSFESVAGEPGVDAQLVVSAVIDVRMMCQGALRSSTAAPPLRRRHTLSRAPPRAEGECTSPMFENVFVYNRYEPLDAAQSSYTIGGLTNCNDPNACGQITLNQEVLRLPSLVHAAPCGVTHGCSPRRRSIWARTRRYASAPST